MKKKVELLSPAGSLEAFYMALANGADAVYIGGKEFSARASALNFSRQEIEKAVDFAHIRGKKVFVALNILLAEEEIDRAIEYTDFLWRTGVDALIVQDLGFALKVREIYPDFELHGSTQMSILDYEGAKFLEDHGFRRIVVGRETPVREIQKIRDNTDLEIEAFCHGALCVSVSGQCLMSSMIGGRSGNRGACAQPCRKEYRILDPMGQEAYNKGYTISPRDLNTIDNLKDLYSAGVYSFKLEGRMKRPDYVAILTKNYARALEGLDYAPQDVKQIFNRTFTKGISFGEFSHDYISFDRPDNRGVKAGLVLRRLGSKTQVQADLDLKKGDLLEFQSKSNLRKTMVLGQDIGIGQRAYLDITMPLEKGSTFQRVQRQDLKNQAQESLENLYQSRGLRGKIDIVIGRRAKFILEGEFSVEVESDHIVEKAQKRGLDREKIAQNLSKFDRSFFYLEDLKMDLDDQAFIPISTINDMRRRALEPYEGKYLFRRPGIEKKTRERDWTNVPSTSKKISVEIHSLSLLKRVDLKMVDQIELAMDAELDKALEYLKGKKIKVYISLAFDYEDRGKDLIEAYKSKVDGFLVQSLAQVYKSKDLKEVLIGQGLNIFNLETANYYLKDGRQIIPSPELNYRQLEDFSRAFGSCGQVYIYGYQKVMEMKHCPMSLKKGCGSDRKCNSCQFSRGYALEDGRKASFPFLRRQDFTEVYNSVPSYWGNDIKEIQKLRPSMYKLKFVFEEEDLESILSALYSYLHGDKEKLEEINQSLRQKGYTRGHLRKGILA